MPRIVILILIIATGICSLGCTAVGYKLGKSMETDKWVIFDKQECAFIDESITGNYVKIFTENGMMYEGEISEIMPNEYIILSEDEASNSQVKDNSRRIPWSEIRTIYLFGIKENQVTFGTAVGMFFDATAVAISATFFGFYLLLFAIIG